MFDLAFFIFVGVVACLMLIYVMTLYDSTYKARMKRQEELKDDIRKKIEGGITLENQDIIALGVAYELSHDRARYALYKTLKDVDKPEDFEKIQKIIKSIKQEEPFDSMPEETKSSLVRLSELLASSEFESDKHLLIPITNTLSKYLNLLEEQQKNRNKTNKAYILSVLGFAVGLVGLYFAITAPNADDIAQSLNQIQSETTLHAPNSK